MHLWLAPFTPGRKHSISITFAESIRIAMIRIWVSSSYVTGFRHKNLLLSFTGCIFIALEQPSSIALQDARFSTEGRLETSRGEVCRGSDLINRRLKQRRFCEADGNRKENKTNSDAL